MDTNTKILSNVAWSIFDKLSFANFAEDENYENGVLPLNTPRIQQMLNDIEISPPTRSIIIKDLPTGNGNKDADYLFSVPENWPGNFNLWQLLTGVDAWSKALRSKHRQFRGYDNSFGGVDYLETNKDGIPIFRLHITW